jgi:hypothetical protein
VLFGVGRRCSAAGKPENKTKFFGRSHDSGMIVGETLRDLRRVRLAKLIEITQFQSSFQLGGHWRHFSSHNFDMCELSSKSNTARCSSLNTI